MNPFDEKKFGFPTPEAPGIVYCGRRRHSIDHSYGPHGLQTCIATLVTGGQATLHWGEQAVRLEKDHFYVLYPGSGAWYACEKGIPWSIKWVVLEGECVEKYLSDLGLTRERPYVKLGGAEETESILDRLFAHFDAPSLPEKLGCVADVFRLFASVAEGSLPRRAYSPAIGEAVACIGRHFHEPLTVEGLARRVGLSYHYFSSLFRREVGCTPLQLITRERLARARKLLRFTDEPVRTVAASVGYSDELYFSRVFRQHEGVSPRQYREQAGK